MENLQQESNCAICRTPFHYEAGGQNFICPSGQHAYCGDCITGMVHICLDQHFDNGQLGTAEIYCQQIFPNDECPPILVNQLHQDHLSFWLRHLQERLRNLPRNDLNPKRHFFAVLAAAVERAFLRECPRCAVPIEENPDACRALKCEHCRTHFCFVCFEQLPDRHACHDHIREQHGGDVFVDLQNPLLIESHRKYHLARVREALREVLEIQELVIHFLQPFQSRMAELGMTCGMIVGDENLHGTNQPDEVQEREEEEEEDDEEVRFQEEEFIQFEAPQQNNMNNNDNNGPLQNNNDPVSNRFGFQTFLAFLGANANAISSSKTTTIYIPTVLKSVAKTVVKETIPKEKILEIAAKKAAEHAKDIPRLGVAEATKRASNTALKFCAENGVCSDVVVSLTSSFQKASGAASTTSWSSFAVNSANKAVTPKVGKAVAEATASLSKTLGTQANNAVIKTIADTAKSATAVGQGALTVAKGASPSALSELVKQAGGGVQASISQVTATVGTVNNGLLSSSVTAGVAETTVNGVKSLTTLSTGATATVTDQVSKTVVSETTTQVGVKTITETITETSKSRLAAGIGAAISLAINCGMDTREYCRGDISGTKWCARQGGNVVKAGVAFGTSLLLPASIPWIIGAIAVDLVVGTLTNRVVDTVAA